MATVLRQELNILDHALTADADCNERIQIDTTQYNGTVAYYFEVVGKRASGTCTVTLHDASNNVMATCSVTGTTDAVVRSSSFTPTTGAATYHVNVAGGSTTPIIKSARVIVTQSATTLTNTETQIEIGNYNTSRTAETAAILTNPKYWKYVAANWDGTKTFYAEAVYATALSNKDAMSVYIYESAVIDAPSWSAKATIFTGTPGVTTPLRSRVAFTPVDGSWYTIFSLNGSMDNHDIYRAGVVVQQAEAISTTYYFNASVSGPTDTNGNFSNDASAFDADTATFANATAITTNGGLGAIGTNAPASGDTIVLVEARNHSYQTSGDASWQNGIRYDSGAILWNGRNDNEGEKTEAWSDVTAPTGGWTWNKVQNLETRWALDSPFVGVADTSLVIRAYLTEIRVTTSSGLGFTKLEPQYLLANTLFAAGTALQTFLTKWDSTEWDDGSGTTTFTGQAEAANGSTSDVLIQEADAGSTVATINNIDNAGQAAATMPTSQNLDCLANANAGDVAAARILVAYVFASAAAPAVTYTEDPWVIIFGGVKNITITKKHKSILKYLLLLIALVLIVFIFSLNKPTVTEPQIEQPLGAVEQPPAPNYSNSEPIIF